ncbi:MAG TPA: TM0106 family RecB-like putative nuclease [Planctomycetota bacterium]
MPRPRSDQGLSATSVANHLACAHKTQLRRRCDAGEQILRVPDPRLDALIERGRRFEAEYVASLAREGGRVQELGPNASVADTLAAMRGGAEVIVQAPLSAPGFVGRADVMLRVDLGSQLGAWSYEAVDTKLARETKAGALLQLLTYGEMLATMQGLLPERFHVRTPLRMETHRTAEFAAYHRLVRDRLLAAATAEPPPATYPEPVSHCDVCEFWKHCELQRERDDHLSLVAGLGRAQARELERQGVPTLTALARCRGALAQDPRRGARETFLKLGEQAELQLRARTEPVVPSVFLDAEQDRGLGRLPEPDAGDVFLDFEGDPFVSDGGREYLTGWVVADGVYTREWGFTAADEKRAVETFLDAVAARRAASPGMRIYHFAAYEPAALKRLTQRYETRVVLLDELLREHRFVDLRTVVREALRIGVSGYGLKQLERVFGFSRSTDLQLAAKARQRLEIALELGEAVGELRADRDVVEAYNREDCVATLELRDWLERLRSQRVAAGVVLARPQLGVGDAKVGVKARDARIEAVAKPLRAGLDVDRTKWTDEQRPLGLLADLAGYFQREDKCQYWEHYRLRELPAEDWLDEREMLAGLRFERDIAPRGKEKTPSHVYSFPPQETGIDDEDLFVPASEDPDPQEEWATNIGTAVLVDHDRSEITIKKTKNTIAFHPRAVFRNQVIGTDPLEKSILSFAEHVRDNGIDDRSAWGPARDLLCRRPPRLRSGPNAAGKLRCDGETVVQALVRLCLDLDNSVLPLQGPPGTGKSHSGALAILALLRAGKTVGVTAVSHKVIDNLLGKVHELAKQSGPAVRLLHKHDAKAPDGITYIEKDDPNEPQQNTVLGGTAWLWASDKRVDKRADKRAKEPVDFLFVDEAGQMSLASVLAASRGAKNLVLLGDPMQLEQPRRGAHPEGSDRAALVHLLDEGRQTLRDDQGLFLDETWRMHTKLTAFTSELYYEGKLRARKGCERQLLSGTDGFDGAGLWLCEVPQEGNQARSLEEVDAVAALCRRLLQPGASWIDREGARKLLRPEDVLVVAPYNAQVGALSRELAGLGVRSVGTVDRFQGQEAPVVIYSCTSSSADDAPRGMNFLYDPHRFNVATSRAKACVIVVASPRLLEPECRTVEQLRMANGLCRFAELARRTAPVDATG